MGDHPPVRDEDVCAWSLPSRNPRKADFLASSLEKQHDIENSHHVRKVVKILSSHE